MRSVPAGEVAVLICCTAMTCSLLRHFGGPLASALYPELLGGEGELV